MMEKSYYQELTRSKICDVARAMPSHVPLFICLFMRTFNSGTFSSPL